MKLLKHQLNEVDVSQRMDNGYVNATAMCQASGKLIGHYMSNATTQAFLEELSTAIGIPIAGLITKKMGGKPHEQGTWVHPQVAVNLGQWCSPKFAVVVSKWITDWMSGKHRKTHHVFIERYYDNKYNVAKGYFSVLGELQVRLYGEFEFAGHIIEEYAPDGRELRPDISAGMLFSKYLREFHPDIRDDFTYYNHVLPDGSTVPARQYPNTPFAGIFCNFTDYWMEHYAGKYFKSRDKVAYTMLPKLLKQ